MLRQVARVNSSLRMASTNSTLKTFPSIRNGILTAKTTPAWADWRTNPESATPTDSKLLVNQPKLPNLPIPELDVTLSRLLLSAAPLAESEHEMKELERKVASFGNGFGKELHTRLQDRRAQAGMRSWFVCFTLLCLRPLTCSL